MTEPQLQSIERELEVRLPEFYRQTSLDFPFRPHGNDWVYLALTPMLLYVLTCSGIPAWLILIPLLVLFTLLIRAMAKAIRGGIYY
jgi:hypothetical protein